MVQALIVVDVQKDFVEGGAIPTSGGLDVTKRISNDLRRLSDEFEYVVAAKKVYDTPSKSWSDDPDYVSHWPVHCQSGTTGVEYAAHLFTDSDFDEVFVRNDSETNDGVIHHALEGETPDGTTLYDWLIAREVTDVAVVGMPLEMSVIATAAKIKSLGFESTVLLKYCAMLRPDELALVQRVLTSQGIGWS